MSGKCHCCGIESDDVHPCRLLCDDVDDLIADRLPLACSNCDGCADYFEVDISPRTHTNPECMRDRDDI